MRIHFSASTPPVQVDRATMVHLLSVLPKSRRGATGDKVTTFDLSKLPEDTLLLQAKGVDRSAQNQLRFSIRQIFNVSTSKPLRVILELAQTFSSAKPAEQPGFLNQLPIRLSLSPSKRSRSSGWQMESYELQSPFAEGQSYASQKTEDPIRVHREGGWLVELGYRLATLFPKKPNAEPEPDVVAQAS